VPDWKLDPDKMPSEVRQWLLFDPQKARQLLNAAGISEDREFELNYHRYSASYESNSQVIMDWWSKAGIKTKVKVWEYNNWISTAYLGEYKDLLYGPDMLDRVTQMVKDRLYPGNNRNHSNINDQNVKKLIDDFGAAPDVARAKEILNEIQTISVDQAYAIYNPQSEAPVAWDPRLNNYEGHNAFNYQNGYRAAFQWFTA
jgi:ABC-type transport system substrate-binding protein